MHTYKLLLFCLGSCGLVMSGCAHGPQRHAVANSIFSDMVMIEEGVTARQSSWDRSGANQDSRSVPPGQVLELANIEGTGCIRQIYFTLVGSHHYLRDCVLRMYWDGEDNPSVEVPFGDFFGLGHERIRFFRTQMVAVNPGGPGGIGGTYGFNCYWPMPFSDGARLTFANEGTEPVGVFYHVNYEKLSSLPPHTGRFHACWNRENPTDAIGDQLGVTLHDARNLAGKENYVIIDADGRGNLAGFFLNVDNITGGWYGEGDDMIFIDGDQWPPSVHGTGSEEIFGGGACPLTEYIGPYSGYIVNVGGGKVTSYRFYVTDPVRFQERVRLTVEHGHANNLANDYSSTGFWYQLEPHKPFNPLPPASERRPRNRGDVHDLAFQRHEQTFAKFLELLAALRSLGLEGEYGSQLQELMEATAPSTTAFQNKDWQLMLDTYNACIEQVEAMMDELKSRIEAANVE